MFDGGEGRVRWWVRWWVRFGRREDRGWDGGMVVVWTEWCTGWDSRSGVVGAVVEKEGEELDGVLGGVV